MTQIADVIADLRRFYDDTVDTLRADILAAADPDATWTDFTDAGKPYGTAMALLVLHATRR